MLPDAEERCASLLAVDARKLERRKQLLREMKIIAKAREWLEKGGVGDW